MKARKASAVGWCWFAIAVVGCTDAASTDSSGTGDMTTTSGGAGGGSAGASSANGGATSVGGAGLGTSAGGAPGGNAGTSAMGGGGGASVTPGGPGCGLPSAAFCDTFEAVSAKPGREGDLNPTNWTVSRGEPHLPRGKAAPI